MSLLSVLELFLVEFTADLPHLLGMSSNMDLSGLRLEMIIQEIVRRRGTVHFAQHAVTP